MEIYHEHNSITKLRWKNHSFYDTFEVSTTGSWMFIKHIHCSFITLEGLICFFFFLATLCNLQDLSSLTRDQIQAMAVKAQGPNH